MTKLFGCARNLVCLCIFFILSSYMWDLYVVHFTYSLSPLSKWCVCVYTLDMEKSSNIFVSEAAASIKKQQHRKTCISTHICSAVQPHAFRLYIYATLCVYVRVNTLYTGFLFFFCSIGIAAWLARMYYFSLLIYIYELVCSTIWFFHRLFAR